MLLQTKPTPAVTEIGLQSFEAALDRALDPCARRVVASGTEFVTESDTAFGLHDKLVAKPGLVLEYRAKRGFGVATAVDVRVVQHRDARFLGRACQRSCLIGRGNGHCTANDERNSISDDDKIVPVELEDGFVAMLREQLEATGRVKQAWVAQKN